MWPWSKRAEVLRQLAEAEERQKDAKELLNHSRKVTARLRAEVRKNHFGEMLQAAMGGRI
jgi:hypothetical protein